jgi:hypothetical protein
MYYMHLLGHFEDTEEPEGPQAREPEGARPLAKVDPENLKDGTGDDGKVEAVKGGMKVNGRPKCVQTDQHFKDEGTQEEEFSINCNGIIIIIIIIIMRVCWLSPYHSSIPVAVAAYSNVDDDAAASQGDAMTYTSSSTL